MTPMKTTDASQNDGIEVKEYIAPYGDHGDHERLLALITGVWLTETAWHTLAQEKLKMDRETFHWMKEDLEKTGCVAQSDAGRYAANLIQFPVRPGWPQPPRERRP